MMISGLQSIVLGNMARKCNLLLPVSKGDGKVEEVRFTESNSSFPICNHTKCVDKNNLGYVQGIVNDGTPFEAELWRNDMGLNVSFVMPDKVQHQRAKKELVEGNLIGFHNQEQREHQGILTIGMVDDGICEDMDITISYVDYLESNGLISFTGNMRNGMIFYVTDIEGKELVYITITLEEDTVFATTPLKFNNFPNQTGRVIPFQK